MRLLEKDIEGSEYDGKNEIFKKALASAGFRIALFAAPFIVFGILLYLLFFYYPAPEGIAIKLTGAGVLLPTSSEKDATYRGLKLLKEYSPEDYSFVDAYVDTIKLSGPQISIFPGKVKGYYRKADGLEKSIMIVRSFDCPAHCSEEGWKGSDLLMAGIIIHEACHAMQAQANASFSEPECYEMQFKFIKKVGPMLWDDFKEEIFIYKPPDSWLNF